MKVPDLSIESAYIVGAIAGSSILTMINIPMSLMIIIIPIASFLGGTLVGITSSFLTQKIGFPLLLSSIVTFGLFHGINQFVSNAYVSLNKVSNPLRLFSVMPHYPELPILLLLSLLIISSVYALFKTQLGYAYAVYGNNPRFFKNYTISTSFIFITGIMIANGLAGISGYLFAQSNNFFELNMGLGKALLCITALILGKNIVRIQKPFSIAVPLLGTAIYFALQQLLLKVGFNLKYFTAMQALLVLCILAYQYRKQSLSDNLGV